MVKSTKGFQISMTYQNRTEEHMQNIPRQKEEKPETQYLGKVWFILNAKQKDDHCNLIMVCYFVKTFHIFPDV